MISLIGGEELFRANRRSCQRMIRFLMVEAMDAKAVSYAAGEFLEFSGVGILVFISRTLWINRTFVRLTSEAFYASIRLGSQRVWV